jgi:hypothetical protein
MVKPHAHGLLAVALIVGLTSGAALADQTGFEVSDGFTVGGTWPAGWSGSSSVSTANPASGAQSIALASGTDLKFYPNYSISEPTRLCVDICPSDHVADEDLNYASYGHLYAFRQDYYFAGGMSFSLDDADDDGMPATLPTPDDFQIVFWNTSSFDAEVVGNFIPGQWYRYCMDIDPATGMVTHNLMELDGTPVAQRTYANSGNYLPQVSFYASQTPTGAAYVDNAYLGEVPEPASLGLLCLGAVAVLRRKK